MTRPTLVGLGLLLASVVGAGPPAGTQDTAADARAARVVENMKLLAKRLAAEKKPDFSGHWVLVTATEPDASVASELTVRQWIQNPEGIWPGEPVTRVLTVERRVGNAVLPGRYEMDAGGIEGGVVGGVSADGKQDQRRSEYRRSRSWDGDTFVIEDLAGSGTPQNWSSTERRETWSLDAEGRLVIATTVRGSGVEPITLSLVYRKR